MTIMDRRGFVKLGSLTAGAAAVSGAAFASAEEAPAAGEAAALSVPYSVFDTDILVIGAGYGALYAINEACKAGQNVLCVDKGPYGFSGAFGMNFNLMHTWTPGNPWYETVEDVPVNKDKYIRDWDLYARTQVQSENEIWPEVIMSNFGEIFQDRKEDGTPFYIYDYPVMRGIEFSMSRHWADFFGAKDYVTIHDMTMITDLIIEDGRCLGAMGIHLPTGDYRVYRAKAVVSATGGSTVFYGWNSTSATTNNVCDNTFDIEMSILRHGGRIADNEFGNYDLMSMYPTSFAAAQGGAMGADSVHSHDLVDANGKHLDEYEEIIERNLLSSQEGVIQAMALVNEMGNGSPNGGVYLKCTPESMATMRVMYTRNAEFLKQKYGFDFTAELVEVLPEMYEHGGQPLVDSNGMCREFEGLFVVRSNSGSQGGNINMTNRGMGRYVMKKAMEYLASYTAPANPTFASVDAEIARLENLRTRKLEGSIRPIAVRRAVQYACAQAARPVRPTAVLEAAAAELERIMVEDVPRMACGDDSRVYNLDWKDAIEALNLLDEARMFVAATLERTESRAAVIRPEFPETDDANWNASLAYTRAADGALTSEKVYF